MPKTMARIEDGVVINIESWDDYTPDTEDLKDPKDRPVGIGDTYSEGKFYRDGVEVLTPLEAANQQIADMRAALEVLGVRE